MPSSQEGLSGGTHLCTQERRSCLHPHWKRHPPPAHCSGQEVTLTALCLPLLLLGGGGEAGGPPPLVSPHLSAPLLHTPPHTWEFQEIQHLQEEISTYLHTATLLPHLCLSPSHCLLPLCLLGGKEENLEGWRWKTRKIGGTFSQSRASYLFACLHRRRKEGEEGRRAEGGRRSMATVAENPKPSCLTRPICISAHLHSHRRPKQRKALPAALHWEEEGPALLPALCTPHLWGLFCLHFSPFTCTTPLKFREGTHWPLRLPPALPAAACCCTPASAACLGLHACTHLPHLPHCHAHLPCMRKTCTSYPATLLLHCTACTAWSAHLLPLFSCTPLCTLPACTPALPSLPAPHTGKACRLGKEGLSHYTPLTCTGACTCTSGRWRSLHLLSLPHFSLLQRKHTRQRGQKARNSCIHQSRAQQWHA